MVAALRERCHRSIIPLDCGWYAVVQILRLPISFVMASNIADSNCAPLSVVISLGTPNHVIHVLKNAFVTVSAEMSVIGVAFGHLVVLSIIVKQYLSPLEFGNGPTMSMCTCRNLSSGTGICSGVLWLCLWIFAFRHGKHVLAQLAISFCIPTQTNLCAIAFLVVLPLGCDRLCVLLSKTRFRKDLGT